MAGFAKGFGPSFGNAFNAGAERSDRAVDAGKTRRAAELQKLRAQNTTLLQQTGEQLAKIRATQGDEAAQGALQRLAPRLRSSAAILQVPPEQILQQLTLAMNTGATPGETGTAQGATLEAAAPGTAIAARAQIPVAVAEQAALLPGAVTQAGQTAEATAEATEPFKVAADERQQVDALELQQKAKQFGFNLEQGADGKIRISAGPGVGGATGVKPGKAFDINTRIGFTEDALTAIDEAINLPPGSLGIQGTVKRGLREAGRVGGELAGLPGDAVSEQILGPLKRLGGVADALVAEDEGARAFQKEFAKDALTTAKGLETRLAFMYARALQPQGKLLKTTIDEAREATQLSGFTTSEETAKERLQDIRGVVARSLETLKGAVPAAQPRTPQTAQPQSFQEGQTATGPNGEKVIFRNGQFVPLQ